MRALLLLVLALACNNGQTDCIEASNAGRCARMTEAVKISDHIFEVNDFEPVEDWLLVTVLETPGDTFDINGHALRGHCEPAIVRQGLKCDKLVASRGMPAPQLSGTSAAHEFMHCTFSVTAAYRLWLDERLTGDHKHTRPEWKTLVPDINAAWAAKGL